MGLEALDGFVEGTQGTDLVDAAFDPTPEARPGLSLSVQDP